MRRSHIGALLSVAAFACWVPSVASAQFTRGLNKKIEVTLSRRRPPNVLLTGTAIKVEVVSQTNGRDNVAQRFRSTLETRLLANDSRLRAESAEPETLILCTISRLDTKRTPGQRQVQVTKQTGTKQVWNAKKKAYDTQPVFGLVTETQSFTTIQGDLAVAVQVRDKVTGGTLDSQTFSPTYTHEFLAGTTPPDEGRVEQQLIDQAVGEVSRRLTPTVEPVPVMLARLDEIDDFNKLGEAGLWSRMLEQLEQVKPLSDPKKDAYRLFNLGVANEALAYAAPDVATSRKLLEQSSIFYGKAFELKSDEKYFRSPQIRIAEGLEAYAQLERHQTVIAAAADTAAQAPGQRAEPAAEQAGSRSVKAGAKPGEFGNKAVIDLVAGGLDEPNLLAAIKDAPTVAFDLSPAGLKQLLAAKVSNRVIAAMRAKQGGK